jgi:hypothetical protein
VRRLEAKAGARTALSNSPTNTGVDAQLRELDADAVINVAYHRGISRSSWNSLRGTGLAVRKVKDDVACPVCAETIKRAAKQCRFCGAEFTPQSEQLSEQQTPSSDRPAPPINAAPLKSTDSNSRVIVITLAVIGVVPLIVIIASGG